MLTRAFRLRDTLPICCCPAPRFILSCCSRQQIFSWAAITDTLNSVSAPIPAGLKFYVVIHTSAMKLKNQYRAFVVNELLESALILTSSVWLAFSHAP